MKRYTQQTGLTLVELMVALAIGSFLILGAVQIYNQSRQAFVINESIARVQETAQFALDTLEADIRMASNFGRTSAGLSIEGASVPGDENPRNIPVPMDCGAQWVLDLSMPVDGSNNVFDLPCAATGGAQANSDLITVRRATVAPQPMTPGRLQVRSSRMFGAVFNDGMIPSIFTGGIASSTHNLLVSSYYVSPTSDLIPGTPTLRRITLTMNGGASAIIDEEVTPGVENLQVQLGIDVDDDNTVDRYVNPGDPIYDPNAVGFVPGARVLTARVWLVVRGVEFELGLQDTRDYEPGDVDLGTYNDSHRRMQISKTILLRNART